MSTPSPSREQHDELREEVRQWLSANTDYAPPIGGAHEAMGYKVGDGRDAWVARLREGRWLCLSWPQRFGCRELDVFGCMIVNEEFARAGVPRTTLGMGESLLAPALLQHGTVKQQDKLLPRILSDEDRYCQGFSEPEHGSDLAHIQTRASLDGNRLVVNGEKIWQSGAHNANRIFMLVRSDPDASAHRGISYVLADIVDNGVRVEPIRMMPGDYGFNHLTLNDTIVSLDEVVGGLHNGWKVAMTTLGAERAGQVTTQYLGYQREFVDLVGRLDEHGLLDEENLARLVDPFIEIQLMKYNGQRVADELRDGVSSAGLLAVDKINWSEFHVGFGRLAAELLQDSGIRRPDGDGYELTGLQRAMLESPGRRIARGTNQIQKNIIGERVLGLPK
ncbi:alkylation response protein AidB-like acyl-CoA dehydrogenase [Antricoccus suffuscus]|uniref:Alkylation response protein AidB-like acyl-CoA dehydrogenase n=1 Tax=Antricoccus suffuscus TaxID=1629062 RepID=A0A2T1A5V1_9ACTN|nr:acyl-CoA dehydrogenase family protein [Antricoccus suffuscus]PRZ43969.1 alkylation response protein AidB-like acyl-CoA dehydrogenase [Antricoccus suffuscus]